jgi:hypothetical protein
MSSGGTHSHLQPVVRYPRATVRAFSPGGHPVESRKPVNAEIVDQEKKVSRLASTPQTSRENHQPRTSTTRSSNESSLGLGRKTTISALAPARIGEMGKRGEMASSRVERTDRRR